MHVLIMCLDPVPVSEGLDADPGVTLNVTLADVFVDQVFWVWSRVDDVTQPFSVSSFVCRQILYFLHPW